MLFTHQLRFRGYWLSLLAWLTLSFAAPFSAAVSEDDGLWMRLCSAHGVQWVQLSTTLDSAAQVSADCNCLMLALPVADAVLFNATPIPVDSQSTQLPVAILAEQYPRYQPRSPPSDA